MFGLLSVCGLVALASFISAEGSGPSITNFSNVNAASFTVHFNNSGSTNFEIHYVLKHSSTDSATERITSSPHEITGLRSNTIYEVKIRVAGDENLYGATRTVRTAPAGSAVGTIITRPTFVAFYLEPTPGATEWDIKYTNMRTNVVETKTSPSSNGYSYAEILTDLDPNTTYEVQARVTRTDDGTRFNETESAYGAVASFTTDKIMANGRIELINRAAAVVDQSAIRSDLLSQYQNVSNANVSDLRILETANVSNNLLCHYELILSQPSSLISTDTLVLSNSSKYINCQIHVHNASSLGYSLLPLGLSFESTESTCHVASRDNRVWTMYTEQGLVTNVTFSSNDMLPGSLTMIEFTNEGLFQENILRLNFSAGTMNAFAQEYLVKYCPKGFASGTMFYSRMFSLDYNNDFKRRFVIFYATSTAIPVASSSFSSVSQSGGKSVMVSFPAIVSRAVEYRFAYLNASGEEITVSIKNLDGTASLSTYKVLLAELTKDETTLVNVSVMTRLQNGTITSPISISSFNVTTDENECVTGMHNCDSNAVCHNLSPSFSCSCKNGFSGNGASCSDINECESAPCNATTWCKNTIGEYLCEVIPTPTITFSNVGTTFFRMEWPILSNATLTYQVTVSVNGSTVNRYNTGNYFVDVEGLQPGRNYTAVVEVPGKSVSASAYQLTIPTKVEGFAIVEITDVSAAFAWSGQPGTSYSIALVVAAVGRRKRRSTSRITETFLGSSGTIVNLTPGGLYNGMVTASNVAGTADPLTFAFRTGPSAVTALTMNRTGSRLEVSWEAASGADMYEVMVYALPANSLHSSYETRNVSVQVIDLDSGVAYSVKIRSHNNDSTTTPPSTRYSALFTDNVGSDLCGSCHSDAECVNDTCKCKSGYSGNETSCVDIDECDSDVSSCHSNATCINVIGSYRCQCTSGFTGNGTSCNGNCVAHNCSSNAICEVTSSAFNCVCNVGYTGDGFTCSIDHCFMNNCSVNANCLNSADGFSCACKPDYGGDGYVCRPKCNATSNNCHPNARCTNASGSYVCTCVDGYAGEGDNCTDVDECQSSFTNNCTGSTTCFNTDGSFLCPCKKGFIAVGGKCYPECNATNNCQSNANCVAHGNISICMCLPGYSGDGQICEDVDECTTGKNNCSAKANCTNIQGGYTCPCPSGYTHVDENEDACFLVCVSSSDCPAQAHCQRAISLNISYCQCSAGYTGDGESCSDIDECSPSSACHANANCTNVDGSYTCTCAEDFVGDGRQNCFIKCNLTSSNCPPNAKCSATGNDSYCACSSGYTDVGGVCYLPCNQTANNCHDGATCKLVGEEYYCVCPEGYVDTGDMCSPSCVANSGGCGSNEECTTVNTVSYCRCAEGFISNGANCVACDQRPIDEICLNATWSPTCHPTPSDSRISMVFNCSCACLSTRELPCSGRNAIEICDKKQCMPRQYRNTCDNRTAMLCFDSAYVAIDCNPPPNVAAFRWAGLIAAAVVVLIFLAALLVCYYYYRMQRKGSYDVAKRDTTNFAKTTKEAELASDFESFEKEYETSRHAVLNNSLRNETSSTPDLSEGSVEQPSQTNGNGLDGVENDAYQTTNVDETNELSTTTAADPSLIDIEVSSSGDDNTYESIDDLARERAE